MRSLREKVETEGIYLIKGTNQQVRWLMREQEIHLLYSPTTKELVSELEQIRHSKHYLVVIPRTLKTCKEDKTYGLPFSDQFYLDENTTVFMMIQESPGFEKQSKTVSKCIQSLKKTLNTTDKVYDGLTLQGTLYDPLEYEDMKLLSDKVPKSMREKLIKEYSDYPVTLYRLFRDYPNNEDDLRGGEEEEGESFIRNLTLTLGTLEGAKEWSNISRQHTLVYFMLKRRTKKDDVMSSYCKKSWCIGLIDEGITDILGHKVRIGAGIHQTIFIMLEMLYPNTIETSDEYQVILGLFARIALWTNYDTVQPYFGVYPTKSKKGRMYVRATLPESTRRKISSVSLEDPYKMFTGV